MQFTSYTHVVHLSKVWHMFPCQNTLWFWYPSHSYKFSLYCFPMCLSTIGRHSPFFEILYPPYKFGFVHTQLTTHFFLWNMKDLPSCSLVRCDLGTIRSIRRQRYGLCKYRYNGTIYFLSAIQQYIARFSVKAFHLLQSLTTLTIIHPKVNRLKSSPNP